MSAKRRGACRRRGCASGPIVMTSLAFVFGVLPLAVASGAGAAARRSMGTGVVGGMLLADLRRDDLRAALLRRGSRAARRWARRRCRKKRGRRRSTREHRGAPDTPQAETEGTRGQPAGTDRRMPRGRAVARWLHAHGPELQAPRRQVAGGLSGVHGKRDIASARARELVASLRRCSARQARRRGASNRTSTCGTLSRAFEEAEALVREANAAIFFPEIDANVAAGRARSEYAPRARCRCLLRRSAITSSSRRARRSSSTSGAACAASVKRQQRSTPRAATRATSCP